MKVRIVDRKAMRRLWGTPHYRVIIRDVEIPGHCPVCGGPRGEPEGHNFVENGRGYHIHTWTNPCGHVDTYSAVLEEAGARA